MEAIIKVISIFIGLFVIANGVWVAYQPPYGDELIGYSVILAGIAIPVITLALAKKSESENP